MNWFQYLQEFLALLGSPAGAALITKLEKLGVDVVQIVTIIAEKQGVLAIVAALEQLVADVTAAQATSPANPPVG